MNKNINIIVSSIFLLMFFFAVLVGQNIKPEIKPSFNDKEITGYTVLNSGEILVVEDEPSIQHSDMQFNAWQKLTWQFLHQVGLTEEDVRQNIKLQESMTS